MTEENNQSAGQTPRPSWMDSPPSWYNQPPQSHSPAYSPPTSSGGNNDILQALQAMPEKVVNAIREATGQNKQQPPPVQQPPAPQQPSVQQQQQPSAQTDTAPRPTTFAEWFLGDST